MPFAESPIDNGDCIGEIMGGENLTTDNYQRYKFDSNLDRQTEYIISFDGGWDHEKNECTSMAPFCNDPCDDELYNSKLEVCTKKKHKQM